jgi:hypothetical protein
MKREPESGIREMSQDSWLGRVKVVRDGRGRVLLIRGLLACPHEAKHVHYYVTSDRPDEELRKLIDWLEWGFWWDSLIESELPIIRRFLQDPTPCMGNVHFL